MALALYTAAGGQWRVVGGAGETPATTVPSAPSIIGISAGDGQVTVVWLPPVNDGGSPVTGYTATASPGGAFSSVGGATNQATISGLANGQAYTVTVTATNAVGTGPASAPSASATPTASGPVVRRDGTNTGVLGVYDAGLGRNLQYSDLTPYTGATTITVAGTTLYRQDIMVGTGGLVIAANNVTLNQCRIRFPAGTPGSGILRKSGTPTGFQAVDCEFDGQGVPRTPGVFPSGSAPSGVAGGGWGYTFIRCNLHGHVDILDPKDNAQVVLVEDCYLHNPIHTVGETESAWSHNDVIQLAGGGTSAGVVIRRSTLDGYTPAQTETQYVSSVFTYDGIIVGSACNNVIIEDCYINGGGYGIKPNGSASGPMTGVFYRRNRFGLNFDFGPRPSGAIRPEVTWEDNVWDVDGTTDFGVAVLAGQVIP